MMNWFDEGNKELIQTYQRMILERENEMVLKQKEKNKWEQKDELVRGDECDKRINTLSVEIEHYKNKIQEIKLRLEKNDPYSIADNLLKEDFKSQANEFLKLAKTNKTRSILFLGTPDCGLHYFIMQVDLLNRTPSQKVCIRANHIYLEEDDMKDNWCQVANSLNPGFNYGGLPSIEAIKGALSYYISVKLKEKPFTIIVFDTELWDDYLKNVKIFSSMIAEIPIFEQNAFYCYFLHVGDLTNLTERHTVASSQFKILQENSNYESNSNIVILSIVQAVDEVSLEIIHARYQDLFDDDPQKGVQLYADAKKPGQLIEFFQKNSSLGNELRNYFNAKIKLSNQ